METSSGDVCGSKQAEGWVWSASKLGGETELKGSFRYKYKNEHDTRHTQMCLSLLKAAFSSFPDPPI